MKGRSIHLDYIQKKVNHVHVNSISESDYLNFIDPVDDFT